MSIFYSPKSLLEDKEQSSELRLILPQKLVNSTENRILSDNFDKVLDPVKLSEPPLSFRISPARRRAYSYSGSENRMKFSYEDSALGALSNLSSKDDDMIAANMLTLMGAKHSKSPPKNLPQTHFLKRTMEEAARLLFLEGNTDIGIKQSEIISMESGVNKHSRSQEDKAPTANDDNAGLEVSTSFNNLVNVIQACAASLSSENTSATTVRARSNSGIEDLLEQAELAQAGHTDSLMPLDRPKRKRSSSLDTDVYDCLPRARNSIRPSDPMPFSKSFNGVGIAAMLEASRLPPDQQKGRPASIPSRLVPDFHNFAQTVLLKTEETQTSVAAPNQEECATGIRSDSNEIERSLLNQRKPRALTLPDTPWAAASRFEGMVGAYTPEERRLRIARFLEKRQHRVYTKSVKYDVRKAFADSRVRVKGRFIKKEDAVHMDTAAVVPPVQTAAQK